jgi:hypothetical protein
MCKNVCSENMKGKDVLKTPRLYGHILLNCNLRKLGESNEVYLTGSVQVPEMSCWEDNKEYSDSIKCELLLQ